MIAVGGELILARDWIVLGTTVRALRAIGETDLADRLRAHVSQHPILGPADDILDQDDELVLARASFPRGARFRVESITEEHHTAWQAMGLAASVERIYHVVAIDQARTGRRAAISERYFA